MMTAFLSTFSIQLLISIIFTILIGIILFYASYEDILDRTIRAVWVVILYILVSIQAVATNQLSMQSTYVFIFALTFFLLMAILSRGQFGIGDALVIGAMGWFFHSFYTFQTFLFVIGAVGIPWAFYWSWYYKKKYKYKSIFTSFKKTIDIDEAQPGMVLAKDNFMNGITRDEIETMKKNGEKTIAVKQPFPFIPVIFIGFIVTVLL
jgi:uncharacterized membrane protein